MGPLVGANACRRRRSRCRPCNASHAYPLRPDDGYPSSDNTLSRHPRCYHVSLYRRALIACSADITDTANDTFPYPSDTPKRLRTRREECVGKAVCITVAIELIAIELILIVSQHSRTYLRNILKADQYKNTAASYLL